MKVCFCMTVPQCTNQGPERHDWVNSVQLNKPLNVTGPHRTSRPPHTFELNQLEWRLQGRPSYPTSVSDQKRVEGVQLHMNAHGFRMGCQKSACPVLCGCCSSFPNFCPFMLFGWILKLLLAMSLILLLLIFLY